MGSTFILLLCFDWNSLFRKVTIIYDSRCIQKRKLVMIVKRCDWFNKVTLISREDPKSKDFVSKGIVQVILLSSKSQTENYTVATH